MAFLQCPIFGSNWNVCVNKDFGERRILFVILAVSNTLLLLYFKSECFSV